MLAVPIIGEGMRVSFIITLVAVEYTMQVRDSSDMLYKMESQINLSCFVTWVA